jgi:hypothetical protein
MGNYAIHDRAVWESIFVSVPEVRGDVPHSGFNVSVPRGLCCTSFLQHRER